MSPPPMMIDVLALRGDELVVRDRVALAAPVLQRQVLHREVDALQLASRHRQIARLPGAAGQQNGVEVRHAAGSTGTSTPTLTPGRNTTPSASISASRRSRTRFSILNSGMP